MNDNHGVLGFNLGHLWDEMDRLRASLLTILDHYRAGQIQPTVAMTFPLAEAAAAHAFIQSRQNVGKVVLIP
jgi:NADPH:quinone reductase-like Zn-dependent oxidoreductase